MTTEYLNPVERQQVWNQRIAEHAESGCTECAEDETECVTWQALISWYNQAAPVALWDADTE